MSRSQMRRQLYRGGGIASVPRVGFGAGSWLKEKVRKLIPNELADIASKAAPFVAPFYPGAAAAMRGIGRFDKRGSISDAMKQAALTYGGGKLANYGLSQIPTGSGGTLARGAEEGSKALSLSDAKKVGPEWMQNLTKKVPNIPGLGGIGELAKQQLLFGTITGGISYIYEKFMKEEPEQQQFETRGEFLAR